MKITLQPKPYPKLKVRITIATQETRVKYPTGTDNSMMSRITAFAIKVTERCAPVFTGVTLRGQVNFNARYGNQMSIIMCSNTKHPVEVMRVREVEDYVRIK